MTLRSKVLAALLVLALGYSAYPYVALYRLGAAVGTGDAAALAVLIDWDAVREGIKEDIADAVTELPAPRSEDDSKLPPFGYSFVRGMAASRVDANVTPETLLSLVRGPDPSLPRVTEEATLLRWAFFDAPTSFRIVLRPSTIPQGEPDMRLRLKLRHGSWTVTRVWLPPSLLREVNSHG
jgi:hypothetical protein